MKRLTCSVRSPSTEAAASAPAPAACTAPDDGARAIHGQLAGREALLRELLATPFWAAAREAA